MPQVLLEIKAPQDRVQLVLQDPKEPLAPQVQEQLALQDPKDHKDPQVDLPEPPEPQEP